MRAALLVLALSACYTPKRIAIPPDDPDALNCLRECMASKQFCDRHDAWKGCAERYDRCPMVCPGAHLSTSEPETIQLPRGW